MSRARFTLPRRARGLALLLSIALQIPGVAAAANPTDVAEAIRASRATAETPQPAVGPGLSGALHAALERAHAAVGTPGLTMAVLTADGTGWAGAVGTDPDGAPLTTESAVTIGSVTKTFTAAIVLSLVDEGTIELDAPASTYLPKAKLARNVTVRQLLGHTSGIADLYSPMRPFLEGSPGRALGSNDVLRPIGPNWFAPGSGYAYSNTNYYLLGHIIEVVTHRKFNAELQARYGGRVGLPHTRLLTAEDPAPLPPAWSTAFWTSGAMVSTPTELARWGRALYAGDLLSAASRQRMLDFSAGHDYGLGAQLLELGDRKVPGHSGLLYATTTLLVHLPDVGLTIAIAGTAPHTDLDGILVGRFGGISLVELARHLAR